MSNKEPDRKSVEETTASDLLKHANYLVEHEKTREVTEDVGRRVKMLKTLLGIDPPRRNRR